MNWFKMKDCVPALSRDPNVRAIIYTDGKGIHVRWDYNFVDLGEIGADSHKGWPIEMRTFPNGERYQIHYPQLTHWMYLDQSGIVPPPPEIKEEIIMIRSKLCDPCSTDIYKLILEGSLKMSRPSCKYGEGSTSCFAIWKRWCQAHIEQYYPEYQKKDEQ